MFGPEMEEDTKSESSLNYWTTQIALEDSDSGRSST